ncbi:nuclear speckle splicing regulatory protein 1 isoform X2 [Stigmatopora nigra]
MRQTQLEMKKALEEDSTVYDYDAVYDNIQKQKLDNRQKVLSRADKKPKYIDQLKKAVENRKKEQERRDERKIQKEREAEGERFADKEAYVTSAYERKLQEQKEEAERERREMAIEAALDVRKQKDLSGFYRHLLNQTIGEEAIPDRSANKNLNSEDVKDVEKNETSRDVTSSPGSDGDEAQEEKRAGGSSHSKRHYRRRSPSSESERKERRRDGSHRDREDRDRSHRSRRKDSESEKESKSHREEKREERETKSRREEKQEESRKEEQNVVVKVEDEEEQVDEKGQKEEVNKFAKRSTEQTLGSARERYMARQLARSAKTYVEREED